jgi:WXG100 family type VII secretion target
MQIKLKVDPATLKAKAQEVQGQINTFEKNWNQMAGIIQKTKGYWVGEASNLHQKHYEEYKEDVEKILKMLKEHPVDLMKMAGVYEEHEAKAVALTQSLSGDVII